MFNRRSGQAWMSYVRVNCLKAYRYFDSLVGVQQIEGYKNKFLFTKRLINFVKLNLIEDRTQAEVAHNVSNKHMQI